MRKAGTEREPVTEADRIRWAFRTLVESFGTQDWWPGGGPFEIMVGAVLTQNSSWRNVEHALARMRAAGALTSIGVASLPLDRLEELVMPAGSWRRKAATIAELARLAEDHRYGLEGLLREEQSSLRSALLAIKGIGPESADAILLYAAGRPVFVVDAYTRRFLERHGLAAPRTGYDRIRSQFEDALGRKAKLLAECHALMVELGKRFCRPVPACDECPLRRDLDRP